ncbi:MAG: ABC transporter permease subunit [Chloroflexota bacterium]|nr:ABC transporter permease subunit [Chloroflexota bacterium]
MRGLMTVFRKELADSFTSWRFIILFAMVFLGGLFTLYVDNQNMRGEMSGTTEFVFLNLYTTSDPNLPGMLQFLNLIAIFFVPIVGIALGFDAINEERNTGTMSRLLSQPIYRDAVINGKFLSGVVTIAIMMTSIVVIVAGAGLSMIGVPPGPEEINRLIFYLAITIFYGAFWLGLSILFSIFFRRVATSVLASLAIWIFLFFFMPMIAGIVANGMVPVDQNSTTQVLLKNLGVQSTVLQFSPVRLYQEAVSVLLVPGARTLGQTIQILGSGGAGLLPTPLSLGQSLLIVWPNLVSIVALTTILLAISYARFMREEIRA